MNITAPRDAVPRVSSVRFVAMTAPPACAAAAYAAGECISLVDTSSSESESEQPDLAEKPRHSGAAGAHSVDAG